MKRSSTLLTIKYENKNSIIFLPNIIVQMKKTAKASAH